ncbi:hypothetical protein [Desulfuromonas sp. AOP6]|uniref:hypothetical protein n=1 Tax=Desulfuromonas sp. AOP6 TaxID=1566351 RepID=UPI001277216B|nr:hypothetical protein [Desulfuromonas sp. AOP6]BCA81001.1 hypothetical protein AOP6_2788 [Desulfuromonas sp. AOP6]
MISVLAAQARVYEPQTLTAKSGLTVDITGNEWQLLPTPAKGWKFDMSWIWNTSIPDLDRSHMLAVYSHYARTKAANTTTTVVTNTKSLMLFGIPELVALRAKWSGLPTHQKKGLNQFFGTLSKLGYREYKDHHAFTKANLDPERPQIFDPQKGALSELEFDSFCASLNLRLQLFDWQVERPLEFFQSKYLFGPIRAAVSNKLLAATVRRPIQLSMLKWSDVLPAGRRFDDPRIDPSHEVGNLGIDQLQIRFFHAKGNGISWRTTPEKHPIPLNAKNSEILTNYKRLYMHGVRSLLKKNGCSISHQELSSTVSDMPVFIFVDFFSLEIASQNDLSALFNDKSRALHFGESTITMSTRHVSVESSRVDCCTVTSNRIRHTVLTRGAQAGLSAITLAKITGVTVPAARHYINLDYNSRLMIDDLYVGSDFLAAVFSKPLEQVSNDEIEVLDHEFNAVGGLRDKQGCTPCSATTGRPIGCYGCNNFRPILEANHGKVLEFAVLKLEANSKNLLSPEEKLSVEKLGKQVKWIKLTINVCNQVLETRRGIE